jgi:flagellar biogenesis protein FliO
VRAKTAAVTGGLGNPVVSTAETAGAVTVSILAIIAPLLCLLGAIAILVWAVRRLRLRSR